jgi:hypothetical protein
MIDHPSELIVPPECAAVFQPYMPGGRDKAGQSLIKVTGDYAYVGLTKGYWAKIDVENIPLIEKRTWTLRTQRGGHYTFYADFHYIRDGRHLSDAMHRVICDPRGGYVVDHINGNGLDNTRANLRECSHAENCRNQRRPRHGTSGLKGATFCKRLDKFIAQICLDGKKIHLGLFPTAEAAHAAYVKAAAELHGEFARAA